MHIGKQVIQMFKEGDESLKDLLRATLSESTRSIVSRDLLLEEDGEEPDKIDAQGTDEDPVLDPSMDREFFLKSFEVGENTVTIKTIGVGKNKPVSVYINGVRWEMFPGPIRAEEEAKKFIMSSAFEDWNASTEDSDNNVKDAAIEKETEPKVEDKKKEEEDDEDEEKKESSEAKE